MKKISIKQWNRDIKIGLLHRQGRSKNKKQSLFNTTDFAGSDINKWIDEYKNNGLKATIIRNKVTIFLPERLNFSDEYEITALHLNAIRKLTEPKTVSHKTYKLGRVDFDNLNSISTSAALVLTAEISKWDDAVRNNLKPNIEKWNQNILINFHELGYFDLFKNKPYINQQLETLEKTNKTIVKYIKGRLGDDTLTKSLKEKITNIIGDEINKWTFLHSGLSEAIINVFHHAYPAKYGFSDVDKNWYLTASYNKETKALKVVFYDQGIGIPRSLPASEFWERILNSLSSFSVVERKRDEVLLRAAVELDRTRTEESDRGKGLQDLLEFIRQRGDGYLSILSLKGLFKLEVKNGIESIKTEHFNNPVCGTLIIWSVNV